jgi:uncharacterized protein
MNYEWINAFLLKTKIMYRIIMLLLILWSDVVLSQSNVFSIARSGTLSEMQLYLKANPNAINEVSKEGFTPLILACYNGNIKVAQYLIEIAEDVDYQSPMGTTLMAVTVKGHTILAQALLQKGANPNLTDEKGTSALMYAVQFRNVELVRLLLQYSADKTLKDSTGKTAFEYAVFSGNEEIINLLK